MESNQIYVSVDDLADWFGQTVTRSKDKQLIEITEDKSVAGSSNLEQWAISMGALLLYENNPKEANLFGGKVRYGAMAVGSAVTDRIHTTGPDFGRTPLATDWGITNREGLFGSSQSTYRIEYNMGSVPRKPSGAVGISVRICDLRGSTGNATACRRNALQPL